MVDTPSHRSSDHRGDRSGVESKGLSSLPALEGLSLDELRREWRRLYHSEPPRISRDLLRRGIGYRLQEIQHGGLGKATRRKLKTLAKMFRTEGRVSALLARAAKLADECKSGSLASHMEIVFLEGLSRREVSRRLPRHSFRALSRK